VFFTSHKQADMIQDVGCSRDILQSRACRRFRLPKSMLFPCRWGKQTIL